MRTGAIRRWLNVLALVCLAAAPGSASGERPEDGAARSEAPIAAATRFADAIAAAKTVRQRDALLQAEPALVTSALAANINSRGVKCWQQGRYSDAAAMYRTALAVAVRIQDASLTAGCRLNLANTLRDQGAYQIARSEYALAAAGFAALHDEIHEAAAWQGLATLDRHEGRYPEALAGARKAQTVFRAAGDRGTTAGIWITIGGIQDDLGDRDAALTAYAEALKSFTALGYKSGMGRALANTAIIHHARGDYRRSLDCSTKALGLYDPVQDRPQIARAYNNLGTLYDDMGDYAQAERHYRLSVALKEAMGDRPGIAQTLNNLGALYRARQDEGKALEFFDRGLKIREEIGDQPGVVESLTNIGFGEIHQRGPARAAVTVRRALTLARTLRKRNAVASALICLSECSMASGRYSDARKLLKEAIATWQGNQPGLASSCYTGLGEAWRMEGRPAEAASAYAQAIRAAEAIRADLPGGARQRQSFFVGRMGPYHGMTQVLVAQHRDAEALHWAERSKGRALLDVLLGGSRSIVKGMTASERERERRLGLRIAALSAQAAAASGEGSRSGPRARSLLARLREARLDREAFQAGLYAAHPQLKTQRGEVKAITLADAGGLIPDSRTALLEYVVCEDKTLLFVVTRPAARRTTLRCYVVPITADSLANRVAAFRREVSDPDYPYVDRARALYDLLLKPAARQLAGTTRWYVAPDADLWDLPFQCLQPQPGRFLVERIALAYAPSLTVLREMRTLAARSKSAAADRPSLLAFGNPDLGQSAAVSSSASMREAPLAPLPEAEREVQSLAVIYGPSRSRVYVGARATETAARSEAGRYRVLHFATHGLLDNASPMYSSVLLARGPHPSANGRLEAWQIMNQDLHADLIVLSACDTARGRTNAGEGVIGMTWAAFVAGCRTVVASQWAVRSDTTTRLMVEFHRNWLARAGGAQSGLRAADAMRKAAVVVMRMPGRSHPFYWAGFTVLGDAR